MKKIILTSVFYLLTSVFIAAQNNTWSGIANNQAVSWAALQDAVNTGVFAWGGTAFPTTNTNQCIYKNLAAVANYAAVTLNANRAANDLLIKSDFTSSAVNTVTVYGSTISGGCVGTGHTGSAAACGDINPCTSVLYYSGTLTTGTRFAGADFGSGLTSNPYFLTTNNNTWLQLAHDANGYYVAGMGSCVSAYNLTVNYSYINNNGTTTPILYVRVNGGAWQAVGHVSLSYCDIGSSETLVYSVPAGSKIEVGTDGSTTFSVSAVSTSAACSSALNYMGVSTPYLVSNSIIANTTIYVAINN